MAGLDSIKHYNGEEGSSVSSEPEEKRAPLSAKAVKATGPYALPTPTSITGVDPALLENMQQLIAEREAKKNSFMESMKDATAWWSGGVAGPGASLARRAKERDEFDATTFGMKSQIAQNKIAQQQAQNMQRSLFGKGVPAAATAQGQTAQPGTAEDFGPLIDLVRDPAYKKAIMLQGETDLNGAQKSIQSYLAENAKDPQLVKNVRAGLQAGWLDPKLVPAVFFTSMAGSGSLVPHPTFGPGGEGRGTPFGAAQALSPNNPNIPIPGATPSRPAAPPAAPPAASPAAPPSMLNASAPTNQKLPTVAAPAAPSIAAPAAPSIAAPKQALPHTQPIPPVSAPEAAPLVSPNLKTGFDPGNVSDVRTREEMAKQEIQNKSEQRKPIEKAAGESSVALTNAASKAKSNILQYDMAESILRQYPKAFGISQDGSMTSMLSHMIGPGVTVPIVGTLKASGIEEARAQKLPPKALAARSAFETLSKRFAADYANQNLTGDGRGTLSNADMRMADVGKGLSKDAPAAASLIFTIMNREAEQMTLERGNALRDYEIASKKAGVIPDFNEFRKTEAYTKPVDAMDERIRRRFPEFFTPEADKAYGVITPGGGKSGAKTAKDFFNK
jgi:hypothetical protein